MLKTQAFEYPEVDRVADTRRPKISGAQCACKGVWANWRLCGQARLLCAKATEYYFLTCIEGVKDGNHFYVGFYI